MVELAICLAAVGVLALAIDWFRGFDITAQQCALFARGDRIEVVGLRGERYRTVRVHMDRDVLRVRRTWR